METKSRDFIELSEIEQTMVKMIGMQVSEGTRLAEKKGFDVRLVSADGRDFAITTDFRLERINISISHGIITEADLG